MSVYTMEDLKSFVAQGERKTGASTVLLDITHNYLKNQYLEIPFDINWTITRVKERVYQMNGTSSHWMALTLNGFPLNNDNETLYSYGAKSGMVLHVTDNDPNSGAKGGAYENVNLVKKYEMTDEDYDKRENTYRNHKKKMLAKDPNWKPMTAKGPSYKVDEDKKDEPIETLEEVNARMKVGDRCEAIGGRRGEIMYIGKVKEIKVSNPDELWVGVKYDEPVGKNDGSIQGKKYFEASKSCGGFVKVALVKAGDYPEVDPFDSDESDMMEEL